MQNDLTGNEAEVKFTLSVTRKATGLTEVFNMIGRVSLDLETQEEVEDVSDTRNVG